MMIKYKGFSLEQDSGRHVSKDRSLDNMVKLHFIMTIDHSHNQCCEGSHAE